MLGQPNFRLVPRMPAPESLGLFRLGGEEGSESEEDESEDEESGEESGSAREPIEGGDGRAEPMETDAVVPPPGESSVQVQADAGPAVNGVKRRLEEDDDYDAV